MSPAVQHASIAAWGDEAHVRENRAKYREKFAQVTPMLAAVLEVSCRTPGSILWAGEQTPGRRRAFARELYARNTM